MYGGMAKEFPLELEYKKPTGVSPHDITRLRQWLRSQPHLPEEHITDLDLILAYHCCELSTEVAKQVLDLNFTLKTHFTRIFKDRHFDDKVEKIMTANLITVLPTRSPEGYACYYSRIIDSDPKSYIMCDLARAAVMVLDLCQYEEGTWEGLVVVFDMEKLSLAHLAALDMQIVQQGLYYAQEALLAKLKSIHVMNAPSFVDKLLALVKPFLKKKVLDMIHVHVAGSSTLNKYYPITGLPKEAGGEYKSVNECRDIMIEKMKNSEDYYRQDNKKRVDESKRLGKAKNFSDTFGGVLGSFKKLDID